MIEDYHRVVADHEVHVAVDDQRVVGVLVLIPDRDKLLLDNVAVDPEAQGKGIGKTLISLAEERARALGLPAVELYTHLCMVDKPIAVPGIGISRSTESDRERL